MRRPRISTFPLHEPFKRQDPTTPLSEIALRLVVNFYSGAPKVVGTATVMCGHLLVTAKHVLRDIWDSEPAPAESSVNIDKHVVAVQVLPGPEYTVWDVTEGIADPVSDIALLRLGSNPARSSNNGPHRWKQPCVNPFAPEVGECVAAFGYRRGHVRASNDASGGRHVDLDDEPMASVGVVQEIFEWRRDRVMLPFPCYQVSARFDGGMSGGPVFDETGCICGVVCDNFDGSHLDGEPISYVAMLWPLFRLIVDADRGDGYPRGIRYPAIELARGGLISVPDLPGLEEWFTEHVGPAPDPSTGPRLD